MNKTILKIGWIWMLIAGIQRVIAGITIIATGEKEIDAGVLFILHAIAIIFVTLGSYRYAQKWSWWCLLVLGLTPPVFCLIAHGVNMWNIVGLAFFLPAIIIPMKAILFQETT